MRGRGAGSITAVGGGLAQALLPSARVGDGARIARRGGGRLRARVVAVEGVRAMLAPLGVLAGVSAGDAVAADPGALALPFGTPLLGRALDAAGAPLDGGAPPRGCARLPAASAPPPEARRPVRDVLWTGVRAIDGPLAFARGARIGIFGGAGCGKSTLLESVARGASADAVVVALVGERGREAERWFRALNRRTTVVCATADRGAAERAEAAATAVAQADALRRRGLDVLLIIDSLARVAAAAREVAVAAGEPVGRGGYPPSVFAFVAGLLERGGAFADGTLTVVATVLSDGDAAHDPVAEAARAALDGHIVLDATRARAGRFPAVDVAASASRTLSAAASPSHRAGAAALRAALAALDDTREARVFGLVPGAGDAVLRRALAAEVLIERFLCQDAAPSVPADTLTQLAALTDMLTDGHLR